jgi:hypothetical protein
VTNKERECIRAAARRYVHEQAPRPPIEVLERVATIVIQARQLQEWERQAQGGMGNRDDGRAA